MLQELLAYADDFARLGEIDEPAVGGSPLRTRWLPGLDAFTLYGLVRQTWPGLYLEAGSDVPTVIAARAIQDGGLVSVLLSIDPNPRAEIEGHCTELIRAPLERVDLSVFDRLTHGDIVFIDNSHRSLIDSDVTVFFLDVLPRIAPGALVHIHDVFLPDDYPPVAARAASKRRCRVLCGNGFGTRSADAASLVGPEACGRAH